MRVVCLGRVVVVSGYSVLRTKIPMHSLEELFAVRSSDFYSSNQSVRMQTPCQPVLLSGTIDWHRP